MCVVHSSMQHRFASLLGLLLLTGALACANPQKPPPSQSALSTMERLEAAVEQLAHHEGELAANLALMSCTQDLKALHDELQGECQSYFARTVASRPLRLVTRTSLPLREGSQSNSFAALDPLTPCPANVVHTTVSNLEDSLGLSMAQLLNQTPHAVVYFKDGAPSLGRERETWLRQLTDVPLMRTAKLLLVTAADKHGEGSEKRIDWGLSWLSSQGVRPENIARPLKYNLVISPLRPHDRPGPREAHDLTQALWLFRLGC